MSELSNKSSSTSSSPKRLPSRHRRSSAKSQPGELTSDNRGLKVVSNTSALAAPTMPTPNIPDSAQIDDPSLPDHEPPPPLRDTATPAERSLHSVLTRSLTTHISSITQLTGLQRLSQQPSTAATQPRIEKETVHMSPDIVPNSPSGYVYDTQQTPPESPASDVADSTRTRRVSTLKQPTRTVSHVSARARDRAQMRSRRAYTSQVSASTQPTIDSLDSSTAGTVSRAPERKAADDEPVLRSTMRQRASCPSPDDTDDLFDDVSSPLMIPAPAEQVPVFSLVVDAPSDYLSEDELPTLNKDLLYDHSGECKSWIWPDPEEECEWEYEPEWKGSDETDPDELLWEDVVDDDDDGADDADAWDYESGEDEDEDEDEEWTEDDVREFWRLMQGTKLV